MTPTLGSTLECQGMTLIDTLGSPNKLAGVDHELFFVRDETRVKSTLGTTAL